MRRSLTELTGRAVVVFRRGGVAAVASKSVARLRHIVYTRKTYLIFRHDLKRGNSDLRVPNITVTAVCGPEEMDALSEDIYTALESIRGRLRSHLSKGGLCFCVLLNGKLAHQSWVSTQRQSEVDPISSHVSYDRQAYIGACETTPECRGLGLYPYVLWTICDTLKAKGFEGAMLTVSPENRASISGVGKAGFRLCGEGILTEWFGRSSWRERPGAGQQGD
jgi:hypothetical protein